METQLQTVLIHCPNCGVLGPNTKFCLKCGMEKHFGKLDIQLQEENAELPGARVDLLIDRTNKPASDLGEHFNRLEELHELKFVIMW